VIPVRKRNDCVIYEKWSSRAYLKPYCQLTIINVIEATVGVILVINNKGSTQSITILNLVMAVIPICTLKYQGKLSEVCGDRKMQYRLLKCTEQVEEALVWYNRTLSDGGRAISPTGSILEDTVPMLQRMSAYVAM
jgi:hypothetical protein